MDISPRIIFLGDAPDGYRWFKGPGTVLGDQAAEFGEFLSNFNPTKRVRIVLGGIERGATAAARGGATIFKTAHYAPRLEAAGVSVTRAEAAVVDAVNAMRPNMATGADVAGRLQIDKVFAGIPCQIAAGWLGKRWHDLPGEAMTRPLTPEEKSLITMIAEHLGGDEGQRLLADLQDASAQPATEDGSRILFEIAGYERPPYRGQHPFSVEGKMLDDDGAELSVLLHADENGRLLELEFIRWGSGDLIRPNWPTLKLH